MRPGLAALAALSLSLPAPAWAEVPATAWSQALSQAWARLPAQQAAVARADEARAQTELARALTPEPATVSVATLNDRLNRRRGRDEWEAELAAPLWLPGQRAARQALAEAQSTGVADELTLARWELAGQLREAGWALAAAREQVAAERLRVDAAHALQADVQRRVRAGDAARLDGNLAGAEARAAESALAEAQRALDDAQARWQMLTGTPPPETLPPEAVASVSHETLLREHPRKRAAQSALRIAQARWTLANESGRAAPELAVRMLRERGERGEAYANAVGVKLSVPLASSAQQRRDAAEPRAEWLAAQAADALLDPQLASELAAAQREHASLVRRLALAREREALLDDNRRLAERAHSLGESDLATLLRTRAAAFEASAERRRLDVAHAAAQSRIQQALGVLP
jgi:cobalt-zinc-cadmium efflux system outer membrane protein